MSDSTKETSINNKSSSSVSEALTKHLEEWYPNGTLRRDHRDTNYKPCSNLSKEIYNSAETFMSILEQPPVGLERVP